MSASAERTGAAGPVAGADTMVDVLRAHADTRARKAAIAFLDEGEGDARTLTYGGLDLEARAVAATLQRHLEPGDRALILVVDALDFARAFFGALYAGVVPVPVFPPLAVQFERRIATLRAIASDSGARALMTFGTPDMLAGLQRLAPELAGIARVAVDEVPSEAAEGYVWTAPDAEDVAFLQYTSGSTSLPKGVVVSHGALCRHQHVLEAGFEHTPDHATFVGWLPLFHDMGLIGNLLQPIAMGSCSVLMPTQAFLQRPVRWLRAISRFRAPSSGGPNFGYELCARRIRPEECEGLDLSCWTVAFNGAEPVRAATLDAFAERFAPYGFDPCAWYPCYGLAESTLMTTGARKGVPIRRLTVDPERLSGGRAEPALEGRTLVGCGRPRLDRQVRIVDPLTLRALAPFDVGEIWVAGSDIASGYWRNPEATERTFGAHLDDGEGPFMRTGDLGFADAEGELYVTGRIKDLVIVGGSNHYPHDIEATVEDADASVRRGCTAAFAVETGDREELVIVAEVKPAADGAAPSAAELRRLERAVTGAVAAAHGITPDRVVLVAPRVVPKTSSGKLQRRACRAMYEAGELAPLAPNPGDAR